MRACISETEQYRVALKSRHMVTCRRHAQRIVREASCGVQDDKTLVFLADGLEKHILRKS